MAFEKKTVRALTDLGLNNLEALVYLELLMNPGSTGYRVAKNLGKAVSNVYQALESLTRRGFVILRYEGKDRLYSPVPCQELVSRLKNEVNKKTGILEDELAKLAPPPIETGIYRIDNAQQLFARVSSMIEEARGAILITADAVYLKRYREELEKKASEGVKILILGYEPLEFQHCEFLLLNTHGNSPWPGNWIMLTVDGIQHLISFFEKEDHLTHAVWCDDQYVSFWMHFFMLADFTLMNFFDWTKEDPRYKEVYDRVHEQYRRFSPGNLGLARYYTHFTWMNRKKSCEDQEKAEGSLP